MRKTGNLGRQRLIQGQKMADWRPRAAGPSYISGPFAPPIHFRVLPLEFKGPGLSPSPAQGLPPPPPSGSAGYFPSLARLPHKRQLPASLASRVRTGILVLQLLTGRRPTTNTDGEAGAALHVWSDRRESLSGPDTQGADRLSVRPLSRNVRTRSGTVATARTELRERRVALSLSNN